MLKECVDWIQLTPGTLYRTRCQTVEIAVRRIVVRFSARTMNSSVLQHPNRLWSSIQLLQHPNRLWSPLQIVTKSKQALELNLASYSMGESKAIPLQAWTGPESSRKVKAPRFQDNRHMKVVRLSALRTGLLYPPRKYSWYSFLLEAESTPRPQCGWKDYVNEKFQ